MNDSPIFGIVQGRLTVAPPGELQWFPKGRWREEFDAAKNLGIGFIELLAERRFDPDNPVWSDAGQRELKDLAERTGRDLYSICTDYIIDHALLDDADASTADNTLRFLDAGVALGCRVAVFPLLEQSDLTTRTAPSFAPLIQRFARHVADTGMVICVESLLDGAGLKSFLEAVDMPNVRCVFDTGNRVATQPALAPEILALSDWIAHVHIKDKNAAGENVLLGRGLVDFLPVFEALEEIAYDGPLVFETTRGTDPQSTARHHMDVCRFFRNEARQGAKHA